MLKQISTLIAILFAAIYSNHFTRYGRNRQAGCHHGRTVGRRRKKPEAKEIVGKGSPIASSSGATNISQSSIQRKTSPSDDEGWIW